MNQSEEGIDQESWANCDESDHGWGPEMGWWRAPA
jgi:hypothetical protein